MAQAAPPPTGSTPAPLTKKPQDQKGLLEAKLFYVLFICTARLSRGHKRRNNPVSKLESSLTQRRKRKKRGWKENEREKNPTTGSWRGQRWDATKRVHLPSKHTQQVKWLKVKFEIQSWGSKGFFHKAKTMGFVPTAFRGHQTSCWGGEWWSGLVGTRCPAKVNHTLHFHPPKGVWDLLGVCGDHKLNDLQTHRP